MVNSFTKSYPKHWRVNFNIDTVTYVLIFSNDIVKVLAIDSFVPQFPVPSEEINTNHRVRKFNEIQKKLKRSQS